MTIERVRRMAAPALAVLVLAALLVAVVKSEVYRARDYQLHDGGVWVSRADESQIGRYNTSVDEIDARPDSGGSKFSLLQSGGDVLITSESDTAQVTPVDVTQPDVPGQPVPIPAGAVALNGGVVSVLDQESGELWVRTPSDLANGVYLGAKRNRPTLKLGEGADAVVGTDGTVHALSLDEGQLVSISASGSVSRRSLSVTPKDRDEVQLTAVGPIGVLLDRTTGRIATTDGMETDLGQAGEGAVLQWPSDGSDVVALASAGQAVAVDLSSGDAVNWGDEAGGGNPIRPAVIDDCIYMAWEANASFALACEDAERSMEAVSIDGAPSEPQLEWRINRGVAVLNEINSGIIIHIRDDGTVVQTNPNDWKRLDKSTEQEDRPDPPKDDNECGTRGQRAPVAKDDTGFGTRPGRSVTIPVLDNDGDANSCDVLAVTEVSVPKGMGSAAVTATGQSIQYTPPSGSLDAARITYTVSDGQRTDTAQATVEISDRSENTPPRVVGDKAKGQASTSAVLRRVTRNVLLNDSDAEGDPLQLTKATASCGEECLDFSPDGLVTVNMPTKAETIRVNYTAGDGPPGSDARGEFVITVGDAAKPLPPEVHPEVVFTTVDRPVKVDVAANDFPGGGTRTLRVVEPIAPAGLRLKTEEPSTLSVESHTPGTYVVKYRIFDGGDQTSEVTRLRVDVTEPSDENRPPVATDDTAHLSPDGPVEVSVLDNDFDADRDVLVLTGLSGEVPEGLKVAIIDNGLLRLAATSSFRGPALIEYLVNDGQRSATGKVSVLPPFAPDENRSPSAIDDRVRVRVGNAVTIPVLANDRDPERDRLTLTSISDDSGNAFVSGETVKFLAPSRPTIVTVGYSIKDPYKNPANAKITIEVLADDGKGNKVNNSAPSPADITARAFVGQSIPIKLPIAGADPEGDPVVITGIDEAPSVGAIVDFDGRTFTYQAPDEPEDAGTVRFTYKIQDVFGAADTGVVLVGVAPRPGLNRAPVAFDDIEKARPGKTIRLDPTGNDVDPDGDVLEVLSKGDFAPVYPRNGGARLAFVDSRILTFEVPDLPDGSTIPIDYFVGDVGEGHAVAGRITITVDSKAPNHAPVARDDYEVPGNDSGPLTVRVLDNDFDPDLDRLKIEPVGVEGGRVSKGKLIVTLGKRSRSFRYKVTDGQDENDEASAFVVIPVVASQPPIVPTAIGSMRKNTTKTFEVLEKAFDRDGDPLKITGRPTSRAGVVSDQGGGKIQFKPGRDFVGRAAITFEVTAGRDTVTGTLLVTVTGDTEKKPELTGTSIDVHAGSAAPVVDLRSHVVNGTSNNTFEIVDGPRSSDLEAKLDGDRLEISAKAQAKRGSDRVTLTVKTRAGTSAPTSFPITVLGSDKPKMSVPDLALDDWRNSEGPRSVPLTDNVVDPTQSSGGSGPKVVEVSMISGSGTARADGKKGLIYTPPSDPEWGGPVRIRYVLADSTGDDSRNVTATVSFLVNGVPRAPSILGADPGDGQLTLRFGLSSARGAEIEKYVVTNAGGSPSASAECSAQEASGCVVDGLTNAQAYRLQIVAHSVQGDDSKPGTGGPFTPDVLPDVPQVASVDFDDATLLVTAAPFTTRGSAVDQVEVGYSLASGLESPSNKIAGTTAAGQPRISGVTNGSTYYVRLRAHNKAVTESNGWTEWGPEVQIIPYGPVNQAGIPVPTVVVSDESMTVSWTSMGTVDAGGDPSPRFILRQVRDGAVVADSDRSPDTSGAPVPTSNTSKYRFFLQVLTKYTDRYTNSPNPDGGQSEEYQSYGVPKKPNGAPSASVGHDSDKATLTSPGCDSTCENGSPVTSWRYSANGAGLTDVESGNRASAANGVPVTFTMAACNLRGCSDTVSDASPSVTPFGQPSISFGGSGLRNGPKAYWDWTVNWNGKTGTQTVGGSGANNSWEVGASPGNDYSITVRADNGFDAGAAVQQSPNVHYSKLAISVSLVRYQGVRSDGSAGSDRDDRVTFNTPGGPLGKCRIYDGGSKIFDFDCGAPGNAVFPYRYSQWTTPDLSPGVHNWVIEADDQYGGTTRENATVTACSHTGGSPAC